MNISKSMRQPGAVSVNWTLTSEDVYKLRLGHKSESMDDKWDVYSNGDILHFHRSWTGHEIYRFTLVSMGDAFVVTEVTVEQDREIFNVDDATEQVRLLVEVLRRVMHVRPGFSSF